MNETAITVVGWVGAAPELRTTASGQSVATFRVAHTPRRFRDGAWSDGATTWYTVTAWRRLAEHVAQSLATGDPVVVRGRLTADVWHREDGTATTRLVVIASQVGHDLTYGASRFTRDVAQPESAGTDAESAQVSDPGSETSSQQPVAGTGAPEAA